MHLLFEIRGELPRYIKVGVRCLHPFDALPRNSPGTYSIEIQFIFVSACYAWKRERDSTAKDAEECIHVDPTFITKGYHRLTNAQLERDEFDAALGTVKRGTAIEANNPQLQKSNETDQGERHRSPSFINREGERSKSEARDSCQRSSVRRGD